LDSVSNRAAHPLDYRGTNPGYKNGYNVRSLGGQPDLEYSVEIEFSKNSLVSEALVILGWNDGRLELATAPLTLPRLSFGPKTEIDSLLSDFHTDFFDACGTNQRDPIQIRLIGT